MSDCKDLQVWQRSIDFVVKIYSLVKTFPVEEKYALGDQMRRAVVSIPSNIAEGMERSAVKEKLHFLSIAIGRLLKQKHNSSFAINSVFLKKRRLFNV